MNKNTRKLARLKRLALRAGQREIKVKVPTKDYHNNHDLVDKTYQISGGSGDVSRNNKRNMRMTVLRNSGGGASSSLTVHQPIIPEAYVKFKNKKYMKEDKTFPGYKQPIK